MDKNQKIAFGAAAVGISMAVYFLLQKSDDGAKPVEEKPEKTVEASSETPAVSVPVSGYKVQGKPATDFEKLPKVYKLNNGQEMPSVGFGTAGIKTKEPIVTAIMESGYRHIDGAMIYGNEEVVGEALQECFSKGLKREEIWITTKMWHTEYADVEGAMKRSLEKLKLDYVDMYYVHWPMMYYSEPKKPLHVLWPEMEALVEKGLAKGIGISNFNTQLMWELMTYAKIMPTCNQVELNPQCPQVELVRFMIAKNIRPVGFTPVARPGALDKGDQLCPEGWPDLRDNELLKALAAKYQKSVVQVMLNWGLCKGHCVIPKAASAKYQKENMDIFDFRLTEEEVKEVEKLDGNVRLCNKFSMNERFDCFV